MTTVRHVYETELSKDENIQVSAPVWVVPPITITVDDIGGHTHEFHLKEN